MTNWAEKAARLDAADPLAQWRGEFLLDDDLAYLDGNSLGALPKATPERIAQVVRGEWGEGLIASWNTARWIDLPQRVGAKIAPLIGAAPDEVIAADSVSVNLFKLISAALQMRPGRKVVLSEPGNFPTDLYMIAGLEAQGLAQRRLAAREDLVAALDEDVALLLLTHVHYKSGEMFDMAALTRAAHDVGALVLWDLSHSAGAVPVDLTAAQADFAVGCGYKYLNGGPGAPAFAYVASAHHADLVQPLSGWMGHAAPFAFTDDYAPAPGVARLLCGTPPILAMSALEVGVELVAAIGVEALYAKSQALSTFFLECLQGEGLLKTPLPLREREGPAAKRWEGEGPKGPAATGVADPSPNPLPPEDLWGEGTNQLELVSPANPSSRGSQLSFRHPHAYELCQALIARKVIGDFRAPDVLRFGFAPAYVRFTDCWRAVSELRDILDSGEWRKSEYAERGRVT